MDYGIDHRRPSGSHNAKSLPSRSWLYSVQSVHKETTMLIKITMSLTSAGNKLLDGWGDPLWDDVYTCMACIPVNIPAPSRRNISPIINASAPLWNNATWRRKFPVPDGAAGSSHNPVPTKKQQQLNAKLHTYKGWCYKNYQHRLNFDLEYFDIITFGTMRGNESYGGELHRLQWS